MNKVTLSESNFEEEVLKSEIPVMVDFWAEWCSPCKVLKPIVEEIANDYKESLKVGKVNVDENNVLASQYGIMSIPTLKFFKDGKIVGELIGAAPKAAIEVEIKRFFDL